MRWLTITLWLLAATVGRAALVRDEVFLWGTNICSSYYDTTKTNSVRGFLLLTHGLNQPTYSLHTDPLMTNLVVALQTNGYWLASCEAQGSSYGFGSGVERSSYSNYVDYLFDTYPAQLTKIHAVIGQSMGGLAAHYFLTNSGVTHGVFIYPICDLQWAYPVFGTADDSFGGAAYGSLDPGFDPMKFHVDVWNGKRALYFHSFSDTGVSAASNSVVMAGKLPLARHIVTTGEHGDPSNFDSTAIANILAFLADTNVIPQRYRAPWAAGTNVGVQAHVYNAMAGITGQTNLNVWQAPWFVPRNDGSDASVAAQAMIDYYDANSVSNVTLNWDGHYVFSNAVRFRGSGIIHRAPTNDNGVTHSWATLNGITRGKDIDNYLSTRARQSVTNGATNGSFTITLNTTPGFSLGELIIVGGQIRPDDRYQVWAHGSPAFEPVQYVWVTNISSQTVKFSPPLVIPSGALTNAFTIDLGSAPYLAGGMENLFITASNRFTGVRATPGYLLKLQSVVNDWVTNCTFEWAFNYHLYLADVTHVTIRKNWIRKNPGGGSNRSGILDGSSGKLIEDNILGDAGDAPLQPGVEFNGAVGNAYVGNFFTNNNSDIDCHGPHPMGNLWEANVLSEFPPNYFGGAYEEDGYFGSCAEQTLFRNAINSYYTPIYLKRGSSYDAIVGNVLGTGRPGVAYTNSAHDISGTPYQILELGRPNIGNQNYIGTNMPIPWNYPGGSNYYEVSSGVFFAAPNGAFTITNDQLFRTNFVGNFTNIPPSGALIFQDAANTNFYWPQTGQVFYVYGTPTSSNVMVTPFPGVDPAGLGVSYSVSNGWKVFWVSQLNIVGRQQLITTNRTTHLITGNYDYYNRAQTWDNRGVQTLQSSYLYPDGAPGWWGTNRWPAIQPEQSNTNLMIAPIPAQVRFNAASDTTPAAAAIQFRTGTGKAIKPIR